MPAKKKTTKKKVKKASKKAPKKVSKEIKKKEKILGEVTHFYGGIKVAVVKLKENLKKGEKVYFHGATTDFSQAIESMQFDHKTIMRGPKGKKIGLKVKKKVRPGDKMLLAEK